MLRVVKGEKGRKKLGRNRADKWFYINESLAAKQQREVLLIPRTTTLGYQFPACGPSRSLSWIGFSFQLGAAQFSQGMTNCSGPRGGHVKPDVYTECGNKK